MPPRRYPMPPRRHPISTRSTTLAPRSISHGAAAPSHAAAAPSHAAAAPSHAATAPSHAATAPSHAAGRHPAVHAHVDANGERARRDHPLVARSCAAPPSKHRLARPSPCTTPALSQREHMFEHDQGVASPSAAVSAFSPSGSADFAPAFLILRSPPLHPPRRQPHPRPCRRHGDRFAVSPSGRRYQQAEPGRSELGRAALSSGV